MEFSKRVHIDIVDSSSGEVLAKTHKDLCFSDSSFVTLEGNQVIERWLSGFVRACSKYDSVSICISASPVCVPKQNELF